MQNSPILYKKRALITGGTAGIGRAIALRFACAGADVAIFGTHLGRSQEVLQAMEACQSFSDQRFLAHQVDIANKDAVDAAIQAVLQSWGGIDVLINNAGIVRDQLLMKMNEEDWHQVINVNLNAVYYTCQALVRSMLKARKGTILNISSVIGLIGNPGQTNYAASKAGVIGFTKALAKELASRNICVNCIAPGFIETSMTASMNAAQREAILNQIPLGRMGTPEEVAEVALFLSSDLARYITGQVITVDGGMVM